MFTGLIEMRGTVMAREVGADAVKLTLEAGQMAAEAVLGESIAVNGCCLTVAAIEEECLRFDLLAETERRTNLKSLLPGATVNLERALRADARLGGHFVSGHVDQTGRIAVWEPRGKDYRLEVEFDPAYGRYLVPKGCIAVDGISLTLAEVEKDRFGVWIIPHTRSVTALEERKAGDLVNLEFDLLAKYVEKMVKPQG
ncbi:MAG: riboflavin synthase [Verrucomicrobium sp.]|nr:riboflavin synthase [Verrucomicrobium sp.]